MRRWPRSWWKRGLGDGQVSHFVTSDHGEIRLWVKGTKCCRVIFPTAIGNDALKITRMPKRRKVEHLVVIGNPTVTSRLVMLGEFAERNAPGFAQKYNGD